MVNKAANFFISPEAKALSARDAQTILRFFIADSRVWKKKNHLKNVCTRLINNLRAEKQMYCVTLTSHMHIPPSIPVVQNLVHWFLPPASTDIWLKRLHWDPTGMRMAPLLWNVQKPIPHYLMLFLCRVFRSLSVDWVSEARRSRFWKRSLALMPFWAVCLGTSNLPPNIRLDFPPS